MSPIKRVTGILRNLGFTMNYRDNAPASLRHAHAGEEMRA